MDKPGVSRWNPQLSPRQPHLARLEAAAIAALVVGWWPQGLWVCHHPAAPWLSSQERSKGYQIGQN